MKKLLALFIAAVPLLAAPPAGAQANERASCIGIAASSFAGEPGVVATITRVVHEAYKEAGLPPGEFEATFARRHEGSFAVCFPDL